MSRETVLRLQDTPELRVVPFSRRPDPRPSDCRRPGPPFAPAPSTGPAPPIPGDFVGWDTMIMALMA